MARDLPRRPSPKKKSRKRSPPRRQTVPKTPRNPIGAPLPIVVHVDTPYRTPPRSAQGLFQALKRIRPETTKSDYFNSDGWDMYGLRSDLELAYMHADGVDPVQAAYHTRWRDENPGRSPLRPR